MIIFTQFSDRNGIPCGIEEVVYYMVYINQHTLIPIGSGLLFREMASAAAVVCSNWSVTTFMQYLTAVKESGCFA